MASRKLPVYLLLDVSGSMVGDPIQAVDRGLQMFADAVASDPNALDTAHISLIVFNSTATQVVPMTEALNFSTPPLKAGGRTALGDALRLVKRCAEREVVRSTSGERGLSDWRPLVFLMTDGVPTDDWQSGLREFQEYKWGKVVACAAGANADLSTLQRITPAIVRLDVANTSAIHSFFTWVSASVANVSQRVQSGYDLADEFDDLPAPPPGLAFYR